MAGTRFFVKGIPLAPYSTKPLIQSPEDSTEAASKDKKPEVKDTPTQQQNDSPLNNVVKK